MRWYDDPVEVRKGLVAGSEGPAQFLWRGRLWKVCAVVAHWVETGPWWQSAGVRAVLGAQTGPENGGPADAGAGAAGAPTGAASSQDLLGEREVWRVEAGRGARPGTGPGAVPGAGLGVFDLVFDWAEGSWRLARCLD